MGTYHFLIDFSFKHIVLCETMKGHILLAKISIFDMHSIALVFKCPIMRYLSLQKRVHFELFFLHEMEYFYMM